MKVTTMLSGKVKKRAKTTQSLTKKGKKKAKPTTQSVATNT
jgi:hypothetical protein